MSGDERQERHSSNYVSSWERECLDQSELDDFNCDTQHNLTSQETSERLWVAFQYAALCISQLYRDGAQGLPMWSSFQNAATAVTRLHKDSLELLRKSSEDAISYGKHKRNSELVSWAKRNRKLIRREDLLAQLTGRSTPSRGHHRVSPPRLRSSPSRRNTPTSGRSPTGNVTSSEDTSSVTSGEMADLQSFRDALVLQDLGLRSVQTSEGDQSQESQSNASESPSADFVLEQLTLRIRSDARKRHLSHCDDVIMDSPSRKKQRFL